MDQDNNNLDDNQLDFDLSDEIVVRDKDGIFKVLIDGKLKELGNEQPIVKPAAQVETEDKVESSTDLFQEEGLVSEEPLAEQLAPPPPTPWQKKDSASFYFHPEDEEEVAAMDKVDTNAVDLPDYDLLAQQLIKDNLTKLAEDLHKRAQVLIVSRLKHMRERADFRDQLVKDVMNGGLELAGDKADKLVEVIEDKLKDLESGKEIVPPDGSELDKMIEQAEDIYDIKEAVATTEESNDDYQSIIENDISESSPELISEPEVPIQPEIIPTEATAEIENVDTSAVPTVPKRAPEDMSGRPRIDDVRPMTKLRGPIDELRYFNITELRRLGGDAKSNVNRVKEKIEVLEEESFSKKLEGIKAWRQSDLYELYVDIGRASMEQGKPINQIVIDREQAGVDTLTIPEFEAITDLNQDLRF